jgi:hypothetical protein
MYALTTNDYSVTNKLALRPEGNAGSMRSGGLTIPPPHTLNFPFKFKYYYANIIRAFRALSDFDEKRLHFILSHESIFTCSVKH